MISNSSLIVGGGVIGLSLAWELSNRENQRVTVLDAGQASGGASWAGAGILPPAPQKNIVDPYEQLQALSHRLHAVWSDKLLRETGVDNGFRKCGGIYLATSKGELATLIANEMWWDEHGIAFRRLTPGELERLIPGQTLSPRVEAAWFLPDEWQLRNPWHLTGLKVACQNRGVEIVSGSEVTEIDICDRRVKHVQTKDGSQWQADRYCICAGAWARKLLDQLALPNGIMPVRGQMLLYRFEKPPFISVVNEGNRYLVPREDGRLLVGSIEEEVGYDWQTSEAGLRQIRDWGEDLFPFLRHAEIEHTWAGLRPGSFDGLPYMGAVPSLDNLFIAAGHFRSGLHLSCGTAECLAELMLEGKSQIDLTPFRVGRG